MDSLNLRVQLSQEFVCAPNQIEDSLSHVDLGRELRVCSGGSRCCQVLFYAIKVCQKLLIQFQLAEL